MTLEYDFPLMCPDVISHNGRVFTDQTALVCGDTRMTWREVDEATNRFANTLRELGLDKGDKVALLMPASIDTFIAFWGSAKAGCVTVPLNVLLDGDSLARLLNDSDAEIIFVDSQTAAQIDSVRSTLTNIPADRFFTFGETGTGWSDIRPLIEGASPEAPPVKIKPQDTITILYTSGTTGMPKGIEHTHLSRMMYPYGFGMGLRIDRYSTAILATPPYASGTWITMIPTMYRGGKIVILEKFTSNAFLAAVERERGTHAFLVPTQYIALLEDPHLSDFDVSSMQCLVTSGQPIAEKTYNAIDRAFENAGIYEVYGFSEGFAYLRIPEDAARGKRTSVGKPIMLEEVRIVGGDGTELPVGETGEIVARSIGMMKGYYNNPELTEAATWYAPDGRSFMRTGDVGHVDADGFLYVSGREKDMIKSGGINIFAVDIEQVFMRHPDVLEVAAIAKPDPKWGETPILIAIPRAGAVITDEELRVWGNDQLAKYQRVSAVIFRDNLPRAVYGKIQKEALRREFGTGAPIEYVGGTA
ncbi:class I adenylate-forming enzyme family protein [Rhodococcus opacus]|uniref:Putative fatty-acid--CoA ligase n=1 Tax=Rhodococcus opacus (strain B4) TaxID=632772 RepID=C1BDQ5_RHOOB|nr:class I adenylate-forming enzyme family protein [Rhodococcus opacus]MDJ0420372.1 class I adenylate-forming enzyme family protein [Rhodococcus opacus]MDV7088159.1 class I adenylate-forming enzyme family protein [Rhodococcus opacus]UNN04734.1 acyl--CoA ligase [Rhodococcus opacus]WKN52528.1 class I adenylate-forming enzyme family protein [Rhodococcus opacus]BAH47108.1 putative fatty-acid--CoA ligase [Rhodococcus opacus B4]